MNRFFAKAGKDNVVSMDRFRSGKSLSPIRQAEAYWSALRDGAGVPRRSQLDPRGLGNILQYAFILERIAPGIARFRLAGHHLSDLTGMEVRGMPLTTLFTPAARNKVSAVLEHMFDAPAIAELTLHGAARRGARAPEARMILLPLADDRGVVNRALGVLLCEDGAGPAPIRFDLGMTGLRPVAGQQFEPVAPHASVHGFAEEEKQEPLAAPVPYLRLVE